MFLTTQYLVCPLCGEEFEDLVDLDSINGEDLFKCPDCLVLFDLDGEVYDDCDDV